MKRFLVAASLILLMVSGTILLADEKDLKEIEGTYSVTLMEQAGKSAEKELIQKVKFSIKGETLSILIGDEEKKAKIKVDGSKTPHTIDITPSDGAEKGKTFPGIYKSDKGELSLAFTEKMGAERPKEFKSDENVVLVKLKKD